MWGRSAGERNETRLLVLASRPFATPVDIADIHELLARPLDWTEFVTSAMDALRELAYRPYSEQPDLTPRQQAALNALKGQDILWRPGARATIEPHWALVPGNLRLAIDHDGIWQRSRLISFEGREVRSLA